MFSFISFCVYASNQSLLFAIKAKEEFSSQEPFMVELEVVEVAVLILEVLSREELELAMISEMIF